MYVQENWFLLLYSSSRHDLTEWQQNNMVTLSSETEKLIIKQTCCFYFLLTFLRPTVYVMHQQFNIQLYALPKLHLFLLYLSQNKQRLVPLTA
jgi:hypothetical protein